MANFLKQPVRDTVDQNRRLYTSRYQNQDLRDGYKVGAYEYPEDLRERPDMQHYVAFYIKVREKSELAKDILSWDENAVFKPGSSVDEARTRGTTRLSVKNAGQAVDFLTDPKNIGTLTGLGILLKDTLSGNLGLETVGKAAVGGVAAAVGATIVKDLYKASGDDALSRGTTLRLKDVITLHVEERPSVRYSVNYTQKELGVLTGSLVQGSAALAAAGNAAAGSNIGQKAVGEGFARAMTELMGSIPLVGRSLNDLREISTATTTNPFRQVMFESVDYRTFNFRYRFFPKNRNESLRIAAIIDLFKKHMHPEISDNKLFFIYPSEFEIRYMYKTKQNPYINKIADCALTDLQVDYGGDQFATFEDGAPTEIGLTLTFRELEQITSEGIESYEY